MPVAMIFYRYFFRIAVIACGVFLSRTARAQQFSGFEGSVYGGVLNTASQPAASADMPFRWDVELIGVSSMWNNNIVKFNPYNHPLSTDSSILGSELIHGDKKRYGALMSNVHVLNVLYAVDHRLTVGAGWNARSYSNGDRMDFALNDSTKGPYSFIRENAVNKMQQGRLVSNSWSEFYITASRVMQQTTYDTWKAGATLKVLKGAAGAFVDADAVEVSPYPSGGDYYFSRAQGSYGYSGNLDSLNDTNPFKRNKRFALNGSKLSLGLDLGVSYTRRLPGVIPNYIDNTPGNYDWKIEAALTDIGRLKYKYGSASRQIRGPLGTAADLSTFQNIVDTVTSLQGFNNAIAGMVEADSLQGKFTVGLPAALHINFDKSLGRNFYLNANLILDASFLNGYADYRVHVTNSLILTPRWEIAHFGGSLPIYFNTHGEVLVGAAIRVGPLVAGVHDFRWLTHSSFRSGGGYVALVIRRLWPEKDDCPRF
ncbi:DUF5723 family protein [Compostibacter hankyongensis]|uniref:DUF5723 family protein n=1 Tax=Compostibacter hankyongensis TaxID=1007089 RepID=UPI0031EE4AB6